MGKLIDGSHHQAATQVCELAFKRTIDHKWGEMAYAGLWFDPLKEDLEAFIGKTQERVAGAVRLRLCKGGMAVIGRQSPYSLYDQDLVTFEEGKVAYDHRDAAGFIRLNALRLRTLAQRNKRLK